MTTTTDTHVPDTPAELVEPQYAPNVIQALARVIRDLPGIPKSMESPQGYKYRGIEQVTIEAQPLFAKHCIVLAPHRIEWRATVDITINGRPWTDEKMIVHYRCYGPGGPGDYIDIESPGIGRDNADKGSNKVMSQAYKYALLQALCIADAKDDTDSHDVPGADEAPPPPPRDPATLPASKAQVAAIRELCAELRKRGLEVTDTNDDGEVTVHGVQLLVRDENRALVPAANQVQADDLIARLSEQLHDLAREAVPPAPAAESPPEATAPAEAAPPADINAEPWEGTQAPEMTDREVAAREALERAQRGAGAVKEPPRSRATTPRARRS